MLFMKGCDVRCNLIPVSQRFVLFPDAQSHQPQSRLS